MNAGCDWTQEAIQMIRYAMNGDQMNADHLVEVAKSRGDLEGFTMAVSVAAWEAFKVGFGPMAKPLLNAALKEARA